MLLQTPIESLPRTQSLTIKKLKAVGINSFWDLLNYFPFRYENYSLISPIKRLQLGEVVTIKGQVKKFDNVFTRGGMKIQKAIIADNSGEIEVTWFNQMYLWRLLKPGIFISLSGEVKGFFNKLSFESREYEILSTPTATTIHTGRLIPVYSEKYALSSKLLREKIFRVINSQSDNQGITEIAEFLPEEILNFNQLVQEKVALKEIHFPVNLESARKARERLAFDELFTIQLSTQIVRKAWEKENIGHKFLKDAGLAEFINSLPFKLTFAQQRVVNEIITDLKQSRPMNRFLQGDVGSGKTVVAAIAAYLAYLNGFQSLIMAPTEILATQHFQTLSKLFTTPGVAKKVRTLPRVTLLTGAKKPTPEALKKSDLIIGTHALITKKLDFKKVGLVVIDEQHRFGVAQRATLKEKGMNPHLLTMTATPIPRTVVLTLHGELDLSVIDEMPKGRLPIKTFLVPKEKRKPGYEWIKKQIKEEGIQIFVICPLIDESETENMKTLKAAKKEFERLRKDVFPEFKLGLLHGKLKSKEKEEIMAKFKDKTFNILVATSLVEVGIDIPNATIMMIEGAERFGMAQLHQLRGRVGRGSKQSYCLLYTDSTDPKTTQRLNFFSKNNSGMELAEYDLKLRGPGQIFGTQQHGYQDLKIASLSDANLISKSKNAAGYFLNKYSVSKFPEIKKRLEEYKTKQISRD